MVVKVNPPPHVPIPDEFQKNPRLRAYFQAVDRILFQLYNRSGGGSDGIEDTLDESLSQITSLRHVLAKNTAAVDDYIASLEASNASLSGQIKRLEKQIADIDYEPAISVLQAQIAQLRKDLEDLEV